MKIIQALSIAVLSAAAFCNGACGNSPISTQGDATGSHPSTYNAEDAQAQAPAVTGFSPAWQFANSAITISGVNFDETAANNIVKFSEDQPAVVASATATSLVVIVPAGATVGPITIATPKGTAVSSTSFVVITSGGATVPTISGFTPRAGNVGAQVTISGTNFAPTPEHNLVAFNGTQAVVISATPTTLAVTVPDAVSGNITVTTPGGAAVTSVVFTVTETEGATPMINSFSPLSGAPGTEVTLSGAHFDSAAGNNTVKLNDTQAVVKAATATSLVFTVPAGATSGPITVTAGGATAKSSTSFTVTSGGETVPGLMGGAIQKKLNLSGTALTFAGGGVVNSVANGTGTDARFNNPSGIATDGANLYIADSGNRVIRKMEISTGKVSTLAGSGVAGHQDGTGLGASFSTPIGIATDGTSLFVADSGNNRIRKITPLTGNLAEMTSGNASVTTLAGSGSTGYKDSALGANASFKGPYGLATDGTNLYVADGCNKIRQIVISTGAVTTLAGSGVYLSTDGTGTAASFYRPRGLAISTDKTTLYVTDSGTNLVRQVVIASREVVTLAGSGIAGSSDGVGTAARFQNPNSISTDGTYLYIADSGNQKIRRMVISTKEVTTLAGTGKAGSSDDAALFAKFRMPNGLLAHGANIYVSDSGNNLLRKIDLATLTVTTIAGNVVIPGPDGPGVSSKFSFPYGITTDGTCLYIADSGSRLIRKIVISTGAVTRLAGSGYFGSIDATGTAASFNYPMALTTDGTNLYIADSENQKIRKIVISTGEVTTLAGFGLTGATDAVGSAASFNQPFGITTDGANLFVADTGNNKIRQIVIATGAVTTLAGSGVPGSTDATGAAASFRKPIGITTDGANLYIADSGNNKVRRIVIATGVVSTFAGTGAYWATDTYDQNGVLSTEAPSFRNPTGITTDGANLYVADADNNEIRQIVISTKEVSTLSGSGAFGSTDGTGTEASFSQPVGITTDGTSLYATEYLNNLIRKIQ